MTNIDRSGFISLEVEENDNCYGMPLMTYQTLGPAFEIQKVKVLLILYFIIMVPIICFLILYCYA